MATSNSGPDESDTERLSTYNLSLEDVDLQDMEIGDGEMVSTADQPTVTVSPNSVSELNDMIGVRVPEAPPTEGVGFPSNVPPSGELETAIGVENPPPGSADEGVQGAVTSVLDYDTTMSGTLSLWNERLDEIPINILPLDFEIFPMRNITVNDGGRFHVDKSTAVVYANTITIVGSGELTYEGRTTLDSATIKGKRQ